MANRRGILIIGIMVVGILIYVNQGDIVSGACNPIWSCSSWSECNQNSIQERVCVDSRHCSIEENKPAESKSCDFQEKDLDCSTTSWDCEDSFSSCFNNFKTKSCCKYQPAVGQVKAHIVNVVEYLYCQEPTHIKGSTYGRIKIYLASSPATGYDAVRLQSLADELKTRILSASYGIVDNIDIIIDPMNPNFLEPNVGIQNLRKNFQIAYYFSDYYPGVNQMLSPTLLSSATRGTIIPWGWTGPINTGWNDQNQNFAFWHATLHELGHTMDCNDNEGDMMRPLPDLMDVTHYPPICLEKIEEFMQREAV